MILLISSVKITQSTKNGIFTNKFLEFLHQVEKSEEDENKIIAMACLKKDEEEQKICTLYVSDQCRGQHLGTRMVEASMEFLGTTNHL
ncbi:MAG: GNAT family N-acetyltransferase [Bacilli bacterium]|nr:MAG: GNAT family N-acetyltransferase [Bacilli bacterium]